MTCTNENCRICELSRIRRQVEQHIENLFNALVDTEEDLDYRMAILDGSWPQAVEILERALTKARSKQVEETTCV